MGNLAPFLLPNIFTYLSSPLYVTNTLSLPLSPCLHGRYLLHLGSDSLPTHMPGYNSHPTWANVWFVLCRVTPLNLIGLLYPYNCSYMWTLHSLHLDFDTSCWITNPPSTGYVDALLILLRFWHLVLGWSGTTLLLCMNAYLALLYLMSLIINGLRK